MLKIKKKIKFVYLSSKSYKPSSRIGQTNHDIDYHQSDSSRILKILAGMTPNKSFHDKSLMFKYYIPESLKNILALETILTIRKPPCINSKNSTLKKIHESSVYNHYYSYLSMAVYFVFCTGGHRMLCNLLQDLIQ